MYDLLVRLMFISALLQLGITLNDVRECRSRACLVRMDKAVKEVLRIDWKPISVFPEETKRFR